MTSKKNNALAGLVASGAVSLDQIVQYLSTWKGTDNFLEILSHVLKIVIPLLHLGARLQHRVGIRRTTVSSVGERLAKLSPLIGDSRMLIRVWGVLPIIQWFLSHSKYPPPTSRLLKLERWQIFTMLAYYPTEHLYYLRVHDIIPAAITLPVLGKAVTLNAKKLLQASSRFYLAYLFLEFLRLKERAGLLYTKQKALSRANTNSAEANADKAELEHTWTAHQLATAYNVFRFPGALHWSMESGIPSYDVIGTTFGLAASLITFRGLWAAAGVLPPPPPPPPPVMDNEEVGREGEKEAREVAQETQSTAVEVNTGDSGSAASYVEVGAAQA